ncbi:16S rRNA (cytosine(1402)-N(4))-methyltransferase RsmH [Quadrisphaera sp. DSM 44207]|uniref:16S rRNA (cytosine(1402)-N(4))-methyltransferase RsmH n=1 Tax=Quadrisphaera sp. DSM 44207 TaxID=1881057 RepID=UPI0008851503|nr:16S rRNA (cytosine(1402)-N(4))-methyltransferase RsmH [Quadrisphaera sp. DSM 44207]SDQ53787.1 16S rRNA (cytosine1402-N4)-methyltransferase [Quadrisphaera sp. DSM 44207]
MTGPVRHVPVLLDRCVELLAPALQRPGSVVVDATLGLGGHSEALLRRCPAARLVGVDRDPQALASASERLAEHADRTTLVRAVYDQLPDVLADLGLDAVQGVLMDLGVSSLQLDEVERGFAYAHDARLDMRMDPTGGSTAADVLNTYPAPELARVLRAYGEERFARRIADAVVRERERQPFERSARLVELVRAAVPAATRRTGGNPAKRTFQALRIEVNRELDALRAALPAAVGALAVGGRIVVLAYHSLEDRMVKQVLAAGAASTAPPGLPVELPEHAPQLRLLTRGAEQAPAEEVAANPRAASVRLRAAERVRPPARAAA